MNRINIKTFISYVSYPKTNKKISNKNNETRKLLIPNLVLNHSENIKWTNGIIIYNIYSKKTLYNYVYM